MRTLNTNNRVIVTQHEQRSVVDTHSGYVDIVIVRQGVQHLHHWCFDQFQRESTNTAAPERTHTHARTESNMHVSAEFHPVYSLELQTGTFCSSSFYKLQPCLQSLMCRLPMVPWAILQLILGLTLQWDGARNAWFHPWCYFEIIMWCFRIFQKKPLSRGALYHNSSLTHQREWPYLWVMRLPGCTCNKGDMEHFNYARLYQEITFKKADTLPRSSSDIIQVNFIRWFPRCS